MDREEFIRGVFCGLLASIVLISAAQIVHWILS